ncbi:cholesterol 24-hydroxylase-like [Patiria miniata]|uniref:Cholesterol 24-hydroxylase-like n=1 Tax=Patiria miniata TaxID=46514 RepID=A0A914BSC9_PATMI|nr:cholesterol 24-hydroxylase-like [Patiria miniata]
MVCLTGLLVSVAGFVLLLLGSLFLSYTLFLHYLHVKYSHIPGPKRSSFYWGNLAEMAQAIADKKLIDDLLFEWSKKYGNVFVFHILHNVSVQVYTPEAARDILVLENFPKWQRGYRALTQVFGQRFFGKSLVTEIDHETWKPMGALFSPAFHRNFLKTCIVQFNTSCDLLLESLSKKADGKTEVNMLDMFNSVSLDCITKVAFGLHVNRLDEENPQLIADIRCAAESAFENFLKPLLWCNPSKSAREYREKGRQAVNRIRKMARDCIMTTMESLNSGQTLDNNILAHILQTSTLSDKNGVITEVELEKMVDHFVTFLGAGQETTACLMASTLLEIVQLPEVVYKMKTEADAVIGDNGYVSFEDLSNLKYTQAVLKEGLRVHPPVSSVPRQLTKDVVYNGIKVPAGSPVAVSMINMARQEEYFEKPEEFIPSRFLNDESFKYVHIPFSLGPRKCIGQQFAMIEARVIMAKLMKYFHFELVPGQSLHFVKMVTCKPKDGCLVYIKPVVPLNHVTS